MKTAKELLQDPKTRDNWKTLKLFTWACNYEAKMIEWNNLFPPVEDDRRVYINTYEQVYKAIDSLPDNPPAWVCMAITHELIAERGLMNSILSRFN